MNLGEICPGTYITRYYRLQSDGTDSSGNGGTLTNLNSVSFTQLGKFASGADFGSSAANKALYSTTYPFSVSNPSDVSIGLWIKLNDTTDTTLLRIVDVNASGTTTGLRLVAGYRISGGDLIFQSFLQATVNQVAEINVGAANTNTWYYFLCRKRTSAGTIFSVVNINNSAASQSAGTASGNARCNLNPTYRLVIGNGTNSTAVQVLAVVDEVFLFESNIISNVLPQRQYYTQAKGRFCI
jgi:hypothetical protein